MPEDLPEGKEESPPENALVSQLKETLLAVIRSELPPMLRVAPPAPPPAPVPAIEVTVVTESGPGGTARWAFGLALSLWVVYNMN
jgi:hypothetical protein